MIWIGLTGGLGTGKSTVAKILREHGFAVIDADELAREVVAPGTDALKKIVQEFGRGILDSQGRLDRKKMGAIVFSDASARTRLEAIVHPLVRDLAQQRRALLGAQGNWCAFYAVPLLYEKGLESQFDQVWVVSANMDQQVERSMSRDGLSREAVLKILKAQIPVSEKVRRADRTIVNTGFIDDLRLQVERAIRELKLSSS